MMTTLTPKQDTFCQKYIELGNASEAYRQSYDAQNMSIETIHRKAKELIDNGKITARITELRQSYEHHHITTVDCLLTELEEIRIQAMKEGNLKAAYDSVMGKAKIMGFDKPQTTIDVTNTINQQSIDLSNLTDEQLDRLEALAFNQQREERLKCLVQESIQELEEEY